MKIYVSHCRQDKQFADTLINTIRETNEEWEVTSYWDKEQIGVDFKELYSKGIRDADAFIAIISYHYNESKYALMELNWALAYSYENQYPHIMPIMIDDAEVPYDLTQILYLKYSMNASKSEHLAFTAKIADALMSLSSAKKEKRAVALSETIAIDGTQFIEETIGRLKIQIRFNRIMGFIGYMLCFISLLLAIVFSVSKAQFITGQSFNVGDSIRLGISSLFLISLLIAFARFSFVIGKSFMVESIRNLDRLHAIDFGKLYLKFSKVIGFEWNELKETLKQNWNIDTGSAFISQNSNEIEPSIFNAVVEAIKNAKAK